MISRRTAVALLVLSSWLVAPLSAHATPRGFSWPAAAKNDIEEARAQAEARLAAIETKLATLADYAGDSDPKKAQYLEYKDRADRQKTIIKGYEALASNTAANYYISILSGTVCWTAGDLTAIAKDMLGRWPDLLSRMVEDGWTSAILEAYDSLFRVLIRNKIRDRLGYGSCPRLEADLFAVVMPDSKRTALASSAREIAADTSLVTAKNAFAGQAMEHAGRHLEKRLKNMSPAAAKKLTPAAGKSLVKGVLNNVAATVEAAGLIGDLGQKTYLYAEFSGNVDREVGALAAVKARCREAGADLSCPDLMDVRDGKKTCEAAPAAQASGSGKAPSQASAAPSAGTKLYPMDRMALAQGFDPKYCDFRALEKDPEHAALQRAMSAAYESAAVKKRPSDEQLQATKKSFSALQKRVANAEPPFASLSDENWATALNATTSIAMTLELWRALPR